MKMITNINERVFNLFTTLFPFYSDKIVGYKYIGDMETIFYISDRSKVIFDELDNTSKYISPRENNSELSDEEWKEEFSRKFNRKLMLKNITRKELAIKSGLSYSSICRYSNGGRIPDMLALNKIAKILECNEAELIYFNYLL